MRSVILRIAVKFLRPLFVTFSLIVLLRGHSHPGGGFIGGLIAATAILLDAIANDLEKVREKLFIQPFTSFTLGLSLVFLSAVAGPFCGKPQLTGLWFTVNTPLTSDIKIGTPLLFDTGVFFIVFGILLQVIFLIFKEIEWK